MAEKSRHARTEEIIIRLARGLAHTVIARETGASVRTVQRHAADPVVKARVQELRSAVVSRATSKLEAGCVEAATTLRKLLRNGSDVVKLGAARALLESATRLRESETLANRIAELEERINESAKQN